MLKYIVSMFVGFSLVACSIEDVPADGSDLSSEEQGQAGQDTPAGPAADDGAVENLQPVTLRGYVASAFEIEVDGTQYLDSEDFYTSQIEKLEGEVVEAGYDGYTIKFDARIGLDDLKQGMKVYISSVEDRGFAGDTQVSDRGIFSMFIPASGSTALYRVRTNKRVNVLLTGPDGEKVKWCYNFSGIESQIDVTDPRPVHIDKFETRVTRYSCSGQPTGIQIPKRDVK